jgi:predicted small metal-binding protein
MDTPLSEDQEADQWRFTFRGCDLEVKECKWQASGNTEDDIMRQVEEHFCEEHGFAFDLATQILVRRAIPQASGIGKDQTWKRKEPRG